MKELERLEYAVYAFAVMMCLIAVVYLLSALLRIIEITTVAAFNGWSIQS